MRTPRLSRLQAGRPWLKQHAGIDRGYCDDLVAECFASEDYREGRTAFMEKRKPVWQGK